MISYSALNSPLLQPNSHQRKANFFIFSFNPQTNFQSKHAIIKMTQPEAEIMMAEETPEQVEVDLTSAPGSEEEQSSANKIKKEKSSMKKGSSKAKKESGGSASRFFKDKEEDEKEGGEKKGKKDEVRLKQRRQLRDLPQGEDSE